jgi:ribosomal protein S18 acetylase RimI-like enzyme
MLIRRATADDAAAIARVKILGWQTTYRGIVADEFLDGMSYEQHTAQWTEALKRPEIITLAAEDNEVVGFAASGPRQTGPTDYQGELYAIYVLNESRGQGLGKRLFHLTAGRLAEAGKNSMLVWVLADNRYRAFYEALGGKRIGEQPIEIGQQTMLEVAYGWDDLGEWMKAEG